MDERACLAVAPARGSVAALSPRPLPFCISCPAAQLPLKDRPAKATGTPCHQRLLPCFMLIPVHALMRVLPPPPPPLPLPCNSNRTAPCHAGGQNNGRAVTAMGAMAAGAVIMGMQGVASKHDQQLCAMFERHIPHCCGSHGCTPRSHLRHSGESPAQANTARSFFSFPPRCPAAVIPDHTQQKVRGWAVWPGPRHRCSWLFDLAPLEAFMLFLLP